MQDFECIVCVNSCNIKTDKCERSAYYMKFEIVNNQFLKDRSDKYQMLHILVFYVLVYESFEKVNEDKLELDEEIKNFNWENYFDKPANEENLQDVSVEQPEISKDDNSSVLKTDIVEEVNEDNLLDNIGKNDVVEDVLANAQEIISQSVPNVENDSQVINNNNNLSGGLDEFKKEAYEEMSIAMSKILEDYFRKVDNYYNSNKLGM